MFKIIFIAVATLVITSLALAGSCNASTGVGDKCVCKLSELHPTQSTLGLLEVKVRQEKLNKKSLKDLEEYKRKEEHAIQVVRGPDGLLYIIDHHHLVRIFLEVDIQTAYCKVRSNFLYVDKAKFWTEMNKKNWAYFRDENGQAINPEKIPSNVADLKDDIYRSLAYFVRKQNGFCKTSKEFAEFEWANYFRTHLFLEINDVTFDKGVVEATKISHKKEAQKLPGYCEKECEKCPDEDE
jgi:hypothetical protein